jgi:hypothetical protein
MINFLVRLPRHTAGLCCARRYLGSHVDETDYATSRLARWKSYCLHLCEWVLSTLCCSHAAIVHPWREQLSLCPAGGGRTVPS